jgi:hypothetical protein
VLLILRKILIARIAGSIALVLKLILIHYEHFFTSSETEQKHLQKNEKSLFFNGIPSG